MALSYVEFTTTPTNLKADLKTHIDASTDWSNITGDIMKATTTRGAELVIDLGKSAATAVRLGYSCWRLHNGSSGTDETATQYLTWRDSGGATSDTLYCIVSASKEHLFISVEGPRAGDTNAVGATQGSATCTLYLGDLVPYHAGDTTETCVLVSYGFATASQNKTDYALVGRDQGDTRSWQAAVLASVMKPQVDSTVDLVNVYAKGDGKIYLWPWLVIEQVDGLRGRLADVFFAGFQTGGYQVVNDSVPGNGVGQEIDYDSKTYKVVRSYRFPNVNSSQPFNMPWGRLPVTASYTTSAPLIAVRKV